MDPFQILRPEPRQDVVNPKRRKIDGLRIHDDGRTVSVLFSHGVWEGFDRAELDEGTDLTITVFVGTLRGVAERQARGEYIRFTLQAIIRRAVVTFGSPIGDHRLVDGATGATLTTE